MKKLQVGDKIKLTKLGFHFHHNVLRKLHSREVPDFGYREKDMEEMFCEILALQGTGIVLKFNSSGDPLVKWTYRNAGMFFYNSFYYGKEEVRHLTLWEKICSYFA